MMVVEKKLKTMKSSRTGLESIQTANRKNRSPASRGFFRSLGFVNRWHEKHYWAGYVCREDYDIDHDDLVNAVLQVNGTVTVINALLHNVD